MFATAGTTLQSIAYQFCCFDDEFVGMSRAWTNCERVREGSFLVFVFIPSICSRGSVGRPRKIACAREREHGITVLGVE